MPRHDRTDADTDGVPGESYEEVFAPSEPLDDLGHPTDADTVDGFDADGSDADGLDLDVSDELDPTGDGDAAEPDDPMGPSPTGRRGHRRRLDRATLGVSFAIATGLVLIAVAFSVGLTGDARFEYPPEIERVDPVPNSVSVLAQSSIFVDLQQGYTGVLVINGVEIPTFRIGEVEVEPGRQVEIPPVTVFEPGNATLTFRPSTGALVERFENGMQTVEVIYWREDIGRQRAESFVWEFNVF